MKQLSLEQYLRQKYRISTVTLYMRYLKDYLTQATAPTASYSDVVNYIGRLRERQYKPATLKSILGAIKQYYHYLLYIGQRNDHPCLYLVLKDKISKHIQLQDLFTREELEALLQRKERYKITELRNQALLGLLIYQGLLPQEITNLKLKDVHLEKGTLYVGSTASALSRTIGLHSHQIMLLHQYITVIHPWLSARNKKQTATHQKLPPAEHPLILTWQGTAAKGDGIQYLVSTYKHLFPGRKLCPLTIRQSVIANLLKEGKNTRVVQVYMGHKSADSTERYKQKHTAELQHQIHKYHPLK